MGKEFSRNCYFILLAMTGYLAAGWLLLKWSPVSLPGEWFVCRFYEKTGFYCPGCGATRALHFLLKGNLVRSLGYHPLVPAAVLYMIPFLGSHTAAMIFHRLRLCPAYDGMQVRRWHIALFLLVLLLPWGIKNLIYLFLHIHVM